MFARELSASEHRRQLRNFPERFFLGGWVDKGPAAGPRAGHVRRGGVAPASVMGHEKGGPSKGPAFMMLARFRV